MGKKKLGGRSRPEGRTGGAFRLFRKATAASPKSETPPRTAQADRATPPRLDGATGAETNADNSIVIEGVKLTPLEYRSLYDDLIKGIPEDKPELALRHYLTYGRTEIAEKRRGVPRERLERIRQERVARE